MSIDTSKGNPSMDYEQHVDTYARFVRLSKFGTIFLVVLLAGMKFFLV